MRVNYAQLLFPDFSLILCGYLVCKYTALNRTVWDLAVSFHRAHTFGFAGRFAPDHGGFAAGI